MTNKTINCLETSIRRERLLRLGILEEPAGYVDGQNLYEYVGSAPVDRNDPSGLKTVLPHEVDDPNYVTRQQIESESQAEWRSRVKNPSKPTRADQQLLNEIRSGKLAHYQKAGVNVVNLELTEKQKAYYDSLALSDDEKNAVRNAQKDQVHCMSFAMNGISSISFQPAVNAGIITQQQAFSFAGNETSLYNQPDLFRRVVDAYITSKGGQKYVAGSPVPNGMRLIVGYTYNNLAVGRDHHWIVQMSDGRYLEKKGTRPVVGYTGTGSWDSFGRTCIGAWTYPGDPPPDIVRLSIRLRIRLSILTGGSSRGLGFESDTGDKILLRN